MIVREYYKTRKDGIKLYRTYSDIGKRILQSDTGEIYDEAVDVEGAGYTYTEIEDKTDDPTEVSEHEH